MTNTFMIPASCHTRPNSPATCDRRPNTLARSRRQLWQVRELLRIRQDVDRPDAPFAGVQSQDRIRLPVQIADDPRLPVDERDPSQQIPWDELLKATQDSTGNFVRAKD